VRRNRKLDDSRQLVAQETGRDPGEACVGIAFIGRVSYVLGAFADGIVLIPVRPIVPVRRLPELDLLTFPWETVHVSRVRSGLLYSGFDLAAPGTSFRLHVARQWRDLVEALNGRSSN
jgi:hypothetical protein